MGVASKLVRGISRRAMDKLMDRVGGRLVSGMADTSSDAPSAFHEPKRDLYRHMKEGRVPAEAPAAPAEEAAPEAAAPTHDHDHDHDG